MVMDGPCMMAGQLRSCGAAMAATLAVVAQGRTLQL
jgi:hypothetical protein